MKDKFGVKKNWCVYELIDDVENLLSFDETVDILNSQDKLIHGLKRECDELYHDMINLEKEVESQEKVIESYQSRNQRLFDENKELKELLFNIISGEILKEVDFETLNNNPNYEYLEEKIKQMFWDNTKITIKENPCNKSILDITLDIDNW